MRQLPEKFKQAWARQAEAQREDARIQQRYAEWRRSGGVRNV